MVRSAVRCDGTGCVCCNVPLVALQTRRAVKPALFACPKAADGRLTGSYFIVLPCVDRGGRRGGAQRCVVSRAVECAAGRQREKRTTIADADRGRPDTARATAYPLVRCDVAVRAEDWRGEEQRCRRQGDAECNWWWRGGAKRREKKRGRGSKKEGMFIIVLEGNRGKVRRGGAREEWRRDREGANQRSRPMQKERATAERRPKERAKKREEKKKKGKKKA